MTDNIQKLVDKHYERLFKDMCEISDDFEDIVVEVKEVGTGLTVRRSWKDRNNMLEEHDKSVGYV